MYRNFKADCEGNRNKRREEKGILPNTFRLKISFTNHLRLFPSLDSSIYSRQYTGLFLNLITLGDIQTHSVGLLLKRGIGPRTGRYLTTHNTHKRQTSMPPELFEPAITTSERPQNDALDRTAAAIAFIIHHHYKIIALPFILIIRLLNFLEYCRMLPRQ